MNLFARSIEETPVAAGHVRVWWLGQEGFVFKTPELIVYVDPYLSDYAERITKGKHNEHVRINPAPLRPEDVTHADLVLCTHDHGDHIDPDGIPLIAEASPEAHFITPECARDTMLGLGISSERLHTLKGDDKVMVKGVEVHGIPAKHEQFNKDEEKGYPFLSYVFVLEGMILFHAGDTIPYPGQVERVFPFAVDAAFLPINGRDEFRHALEFEGNFSCEEAIGFGLAVKAKLTVPMHYDTFTLNTVDVRDFRRLADHRGLRYVVMEHAGTMELPLEDA